MNRERIRQVSERQPDLNRERSTGEQSHVQTESPVSILPNGMTQRQRGMLAAQRTIGNRAAIQRMMVQRDDTDPAATAPTADPAGGQSVSGSGGSVSVDGSGISINSSGPLVLNAPSIEANTAMLGQPGVTRTGTLIADTVMGSSYTPGAGNMW